MSPTKKTKNADLRSYTTSLQATDKVDAQILFRGNIKFYELVTSLNVQ